MGWQWPACLTKGGWLEAPSQIPADKGFEYSKVLRCFGSNPQLYMISSLVFLVRYDDRSISWMKNEKCEPGEFITRIQKCLFSSKVQVQKRNVFGQALFMFLYNINPPTWCGLHSKNMVLMSNGYFSTLFRFVPHLHFSIWPRGQTISSLRISSVLRPNRLQSREVMEYTFSRCLMIWDLKSTEMFDKCNRNEANT